MMKSSRKKRLGMVILTAMLVVGMLATWLLVRQAQKRTTFWSEVDPVTWYRYRITLSADWKREEEGTPYAFSFVESSGSPVRQWIQRHLWRRKVAIPPEIILASYPLIVLPTATEYPELTPEPGERVLMKQHLHIDGCAATLLAVENPPRTQYREQLLVYVPASATLYNAVGLSEPSGASRLDHEMQKMIVSFHTETIPVSGTDLEVIERALSDWQAVNGLERRNSGDDEVVVYNRCFEDFKPHNRKLVLSDMQAFLAETYRAPGYMNDAYKVSRPVWKKFYPNAFACIYVGRPTYPDHDTAVLELQCAESSGETKNRYTLKRKQGQWSIIQRNALRSE